MFVRWRAYDPTFTAFDTFRRRMSQLVDELSHPEERASMYESRWPRIDLEDAGDKLLLHAEMPGVEDKDINVTLNQDVLSLSGERKANVPEGYAVHRKERGSVRFSRSFSLPCKVDPEKVSAVSRNGILTIELAKAAEAQPRQITVKASS